MADSEGVWTCQGFIGLGGQQQVAGIQDHGVVATAHSDSLGDIVQGINIGVAGKGIDIKSGAGKSTVGGVFTKA